MCMSCGCGKPMEDHGNPDNITYQDLEKAGRVEGISPEQALENMNDAMQKVGGGS